MALGIEDLKAKVSTMSSTWDATGDGKLDADDIFKTFDKSGDGLLDESEIAPLVAQLSDQIDFNNALLEEMSSLEEAQLASQVAMKENKKKLGQALEVAESARSEAKEWRRKFMVTKEVADDSSKKLTDVRVEFNSLRREKEALLTDVESLARKNLEAAGQAELAEAARAAREKEGKEAEIDTNGRVEELSQRLKALGNTNKMLQSQADKMRVTAGEVEGELASLRANHGEKLRELAGANEAVRGAMGQKEKVLMRERDTEEELIRTKVLKTKFQNEAEEAEAKVEVLKNENKENESRLTDLQAEVRGSESTIATLKREAAEQKELSENLSNDLEESNAEVRAVLKAKNDARLHFEKKLGSAQEKIALLAEDMRRESDDHVVDVQKMVGEINDNKIIAEEKIMQLEKEIESLRGLLKLKNDTSTKMLVDMQKERETYDDTIRWLNQEINEKDVVVAGAKEERNEFSIRTSNTITAMEKEKQELASKYVAGIEQMQQALKNVSHENHMQKEQMNEMSGQFVTLATFVRSLEASQSKPVNGWYNEVVKSLELLVEQNSGVKASLENAKDDLKRANLEKLDEKSKNLMLDEEVNRLEHEIGMLSGESGEKENEKVDLQRKHERLMSTLSDELKASGELLHKYKFKLSESEAKCNSMVGEAQKGGENLETAHKTHTERYNKLEGKVSSMDAEIKKLQFNYDGIVKQRDVLQKGVEELERTARNRMMEMSNSEKRFEAKLADEESRMKKVLQSTSDGNRTNQQLQKQVEQTKKLLLTIQQQKHNLVEECAQLKGELDAIYARGLNN
ncbi:hypothetical protein ScalyP_jg9475 [Parmales sp. scaly parma]|nr:hypothetical protein ScalyP_jg9475 [Parmales sp. scaly parma]